MTNTKLLRRKRRAFAKKLGGGPKAPGPLGTAWKAAAKIRPGMLHRGLSESVAKDDREGGDKYREQISKIPPRYGNQVCEVGDKILLEKPGGAGIVPSSPDESKMHHNESARECGETQEDTLESAFAYLGGGYGISESESEGVREEAAIRQGLDLVRWAEQKGLILSQDFLKGAEIGGSEHELLVRGEQFWKITRPGNYGWTVLPDRDGNPFLSVATPLEYLARWINANVYFGDKAVLRGVVRTDHGIRIVVSQPYVHGSIPNRLQVLDGMRSMGFSPVPKLMTGGGGLSFYREVDNVAVFDGSEDNFIVSGGLPLPVDVIAMIPGPKLSEQIRELFRAE